MKDDLLYFMIIKNCHGLIIHCADATAINGNI